MSKKLVLILLTVLATFSIQAQSLDLIEGADYVKWSAPAVGGSGCVGGATEVSINFYTDLHGAVIGFNNLGNDSRGKKDLILRKNCSIRIPASVARGYSLGVRAKSASGFIAQSRGVTAKAQVDVGLVGDPQEKLEKTWSQASNANFQLSDDLMAGDFAWSRCGDDAILSVNASVLAQKAKAKYQHLLTIEVLELEFAIRRCQ